VGGDAGAAPQLAIVHTGANLGFTGGNNVGMRYVLARGEAKYLLLLNNDTVIAPNALSELVAMAERDSGIGAVGATMLDYRDTELVQAAAGGTFAPWHGMVRASQEGVRRGTTVARPALDFVSGGCLLAPTAVVRTVGLFDERFFIYGEDQDFSLRIRRAGHTLAYCPAAELWHLGGGTTVPGSPFNDYHNVRSSLHFVAKHWPYLLPAAAAYSIYRCVLPKIVRRQWPRLRAAGRGYRDFMRDLASRRFTTTA
jgi:GT2 family glycosyltransferase